MSIWADTFNEPSYYQPTENDMKEWSRCLEEAEGDGMCGEEYEDWNEFDDSMDGDHRTALESVYGPEDYDDSNDYL